MDKSKTNDVDEDSERKIRNELCVDDYEDIISVDANMDNDSEVILANNVSKEEID